MPGNFLRIISFGFGVRRGQLFRQRHFWRQNRLLPSTSRSKDCLASTSQTLEDCDKPNFRWPGLMIATLNQWVIDFMEKEALVAPGRPSLLANQVADGEPSPCPASTRHRSERSSPLQQAEADELMVSRTTIARLTSSSKQRAISE